MKKHIPIDPDIQRAAEKFVRGCVHILETHGDGVVPGFNFNETAYKVAEVPQKARNLQAIRNLKKAMNR